MTKRAIHRAAEEAAKHLLEVIASALHPSVHRDYYEEAYRLCRDLIEACQRQAGRELMRVKPSMN